MAENTEAKAVNIAPGPLSFFVLLVPFILTAMIAYVTVGL